MHIKPNKSWWLLGLGVLLGAGAAYAADPRYDEADATINKAEALLNARKLATAARLAITSGRCTRCRHSSQNPHKDSSRTGETKKSPR